MSLIHGDKSVFALHLKGDSKALVSLGAIMVGTVVFPAMVKLGKPILKSIIKTGLTLYPPKKPVSSSTLELQQLKLISARSSKLNLN